MQKLSVEVLEKMLGADLSNHEIDMMLYIARFQDEFGHIRGVYYRDICENVGLSYQGFYDCLHSLERKGIIACEKRSYLEPFMDVYLEKGRKYFITFKKGAYEALPGRDSENDELRNHTVTISCRRNRIKDENRQKEEEICTILKQHHKDIIKNLEFDLSAIIRESLARINASIHNKYKWKRYLNPALVHKIVIEELANA